MGLAAACAKQGAPPGGPEDRRPPVVVRTFPDTFAVLETFEGPVRFDFDERISERVDGGALDGIVIVSPATGAVRVRHERQSLLVDLDGGFRDGVVYRVTLLASVRDLFNNQLRDPFEFVFSTGPTPVETTVAGLAWDRITGRPSADHRVHAVPMEGDSTPYIAVADTGGVFALRYLPEGRYDIIVFEDRNRDDVLDPGEPRGRQRQLVGPGAPLILNLPVLAPDTTPAVLTRVTALDSVTVVLEFDDFLDPAVRVDGVGVSIALDSGGALPVEQILHENEYESWVDQVADSFFRLDSVAAAVRAEENRIADSIAAAQAGASPDSAVVASSDSVVTDVSAAVDPPAPDPNAPADTVVITDPGQAAAPPARTLPPRVPGAGSRPSRAGAQGERPAPATGPGSLMLLPSQRVVVRLAEPLVPNAGYAVVIAAVRNINAIPLGGGEAALVLEPPPAADSTGAPGDSVGAPQDSLTAIDTAGVLPPPDTGAVIDTSGVIDTLRAGRR